MKVSRLFKKRLRTLSRHTEGIGEFGGDLQYFGQCLTRERMIECSINLVEGHPVRE